MSPLVSLIFSLLHGPIDPAPMQVPGALLEVTSMPEPSGIVYSPQLARYLVISDDTGDKRLGTNHAPIVFTMDGAGQLDAAPLPIVGIDKLNDAEAICEGPDGTFLLATSQSKNRRALDKKSRRQLLKLQVQGHALQVLAKLDLAAAIAASGVVNGALDIEALAYRDGTLYAGLKSPQDAQGASMILRIANINAALRQGQIEPQQIAPWLKVPLRVSGESGPIVQGISDMRFLADGSLVLLANSPKRMPADGGGALYLVRPGESPQLWRRFVGLKPEGVTMTADGRALIIVFDCDRQQPQWLLQSLPTPDSLKARRP